MSKLRQPTLPDVAFLILLLLVVVALAQGLVAYLSVAGNALRFPYPLEYGEGPVLEQALQLSRGAPMYSTDFAQPPYTLATTPPLFQWLLAPLVAASGPAFWYGRAISILSAFAAALLIGMIVHRLTRDWLASLISGLLLLCYPQIALWSLFSRVETLGLALSLGGLYVVLRWPARWPALAAAAALFVAAIIAKPTYAIAAPATACVWLWADQKKRREAVALAAGVAVAAALILVALNAATNGGLFLNVVVGDGNAFEFYRVIEAFILIFVHSAFIIIAGLFFLSLERITERTRSWGFVLTYLVFSLLSALFIGNASAGMNAVVELVAAVCMLFGATMAWLGRNPWLRVVALGVVAFQLADLNEWTQTEHLALASARIEQRREIERLSAIMREASGNVLVDEYMGMLPADGQRIYIQPFEFTQLQERGLWSDANLVERINRREFPLVVLYEPMGRPPLIVQRWPKRVRDAIYANYEMSDRLAETLIYRPK
jgi:hypothetical protein